MGGCCYWPVGGQKDRVNTAVEQLRAVTTRYTCGDCTQEHTHTYQRHSHSQNHTKVHNKNTVGHIAETLEQTERHTQAHNYPSNTTQQRYVKLRCVSKSKFKFKCLQLSSTK